MAAVSSDRPERDGRERRPPPRRSRRRGLSPLLVAALVAAAFLVGAGIGYVVRGAPSSGDNVTVEQTVPVVTVTVEAP